MPPVLPDPNRALVNVLNDLVRRVRALETQYTRWYVDNAGNNVAIAGKLAADTSGNATGLGNAFGFAFKSASGTWQNIATALQTVEAIVSPVVGQQTPIGTSGSTSSITPGGLTGTTGPSVTVTTGASGKVLIEVTSEMIADAPGGGTSESEIYYQVDGGTAQQWVNTSLTSTSSSFGATMCGAGFQVLNLSPNASHTIDVQYASPQGVSISFVNTNLIATVLG